MNSAFPHDDYPDNWREIATRVKDEAGWKCIRCEHPHDVANGYCLTVHHMDGRRANCRWWNLPALCQRCHLSIQNRVVIRRPYLFEHTDWIKPYVGGYYAHCLGLSDEREFVMANLDLLISTHGLRPVISITEGVSLSLELPY
jgi:hypothetical protein